MKHLLLSLLLVAGYCTILPAQADPPPAFVTGALTVACSSDPCAKGSTITLSMPYANSACTFNVSGTYSGTVQFEQTNASPVNGPWSSLTLQPNTYSTPVSSTTSSFYGSNALIGGIAVRARMSSSVSGSAAVTLSCASASATALNGTFTALQPSPPAAGVCIAISTPPAQGTISVAPVCNPNLISPQPCGSISGGWHIECGLVSLSNTCSGNALCNGNKALSFGSSYASAPSCVFGEKGGGDSGITPTFLSVGTSTASVEWFNTQSGSFTGTTSTYVICIGV